LTFSEEFDGKLFFIFLPTHVDGILNQKTAFLIKFSWWKTNFDRRRRKWKSFHADQKLLGFVLVFNTLQEPLSVNQTNFNWISGFPWKLFWPEIYANIICKTTCPKLTQIDSCARSNGKTGAHSNNIFSISIIIKFHITIHNHLSSSLQVIWIETN
jgi:hypothetical protein